ncbi:hypothetical protein T05_3645, partial [Trichinella murrelli]
MLIRRKIQSPFINFASIASGHAHFNHSFISDFFTFHACCFFSNCKKWRRFDVDLKFYSTFSNNYADCLFNCISANSRARIDSIFKRNVYPIFKNSQQRIRLPVFPLPIGSIFQRQTAYEQPLVFPFRLLHITLNFAFDKDK